MRLGIHVNEHLRGERLSRFQAYIDAVRPPFVKFLADGWNPWLADWCRSKGCKVIVRRVSSCEGGRPHPEVLDWVRSQNVIGHADYVENCNEVFHEGDDFNRYCGKSIDFMREVRTLGLKSVVGNWGVGSPYLKVAGDPYDAWALPNARAMLDEAGRHGDLIGLHSYYKPLPWFGVEGDPHDWGNVGGFWMLRRKWDVDVWKQLGIRVPKFVITESGRDDVRGVPGHGKGYHDEPVTPDGDYADFMAWYCWHLTRIPECAGVVDFGFGTTKDEWKTFDLSVDPVMLARMQYEMLRIPRGTMAMEELDRLADEAQASQVIEFNPDAAIHKSAIKRGWKGPSPNGSEFTSSAAGFAGRTCQRFEWPDGRVEVGVWLGGENVGWRDITHIVRPKA